MKNILLRISIFLLKNILLRILILMFGLGGPTLTFVLYASGENWDVDPMKLLIPISIGFIVSLVIAVIVHFLIKNFGICVLTSTGICLLTYLLLMTFILFDLTDPEAVMWLPVALIVACITCFPMALSASGSTILLLRFNDIIKNGKWKEWILP